jgi:hypothetical protein
MLGLLAFVALFTAIWDKVSAASARIAYERAGPHAGPFGPPVILVSVSATFLFLAAVYPFVRFLNWLYGV